VAVLAAWCTHCVPAPDQIRPDASVRAAYLGDDETVDGAHHDEPA
jgi:hypothetical protein